MYTGKVLNFYNFGVCKVDRLEKYILFWLI